jgi:hypothetical protein
MLEALPDPCLGGVALPLLVIQLVEVVAVFSDVLQVGRQLEEFLVFVAVLVTLAEGFDAETWKGIEWTLAGIQLETSTTHRSSDSSRNSGGCRRT